MPARRLARIGESQLGPVEELVRLRGREVPTCTGAPDPPGQETLPVARRSIRTLVVPLRGTTTVRPSAKTRGGAPLAGAGAPGVTTGVVA